MWISFLVEWGTHVGKWRQQPSSQSARWTHGLLTFELRSALGATLSIFVSEKWDVCKALSVDSETNCCRYVLCFSEGTIDFCWMYSQKGSYECRCFIYIVCMTLLVNRETDWSFCFLLEAECCYKVSRVGRYITVTLGTFSILSL